MLSCNAAIALCSLKRVKLAWKVLNGESWIALSRDLIMYISHVCKKINHLSSVVAKLHCDTLE